jgi:hypothetical protein
MVRFIKDTTGRFATRPHYDPKELDRECEQVLLSFFSGKIPTPIETDDLTRLIERDTSDFDPGADLSSYGQDVEGVTEFKPGRKPRVRIVASLAYDDVRQNRYRTTLSHEYGHVHFHRSLFDMAPSAADLFGPQNAKGAEQICKRESIMNARKTDWMEWQAGYVCGALLMPISRLRKIVGGFQQTHEVFGALGVTTARGTELIEKVRGEFQVSFDAARVRLMQHGYIQTREQGRSLLA